MHTLTFRHESKDLLAEGETGCTNEMRRRPWVDYSPHYQVLMLCQLRSVSRYCNFFFFLEVLESKVQRRIVKFNDAGTLTELSLVELNGI